MQLIRVVVLKSVETFELGIAIDDPYIIGYRVGWPAHRVVARHITHITP